MIKNKRIFRDKKGQFIKGFYVGFGFKKGDLVWNKGKKGIHLSSSSEFKKGMIPWNKGKMVKKINEYSNKYDAIHDWVQRWIKCLNRCEKCNKVNNLQWSNKSGKYYRTKDDWQKLCIKCHQRYDFENFGLRKAFYKK